MIKKLFIFLFILYNTAVAQNQDCMSAIQICSNSTFTANNNGKGSTNDLSASNRGCLVSNENQSSWYLLKIQTGGTLTMLIDPITNSNDYDFAVWGPSTSCPPTSNPIRCSYACHGLPPRCIPPGTVNSNTGLTLSATDLTEGASGDGYVKYLDVLAGQTYLIMIDNFSASNSGFSITFGGTAVLGCTVLPVEIIQFTGKYMHDNIYIQWKTANEVNLDKFILEKFSNNNWRTIIELPSTGNNNTYNYYDTCVTYQSNVYRLRSIDLDGTYKYYDRIVSIDCPGIKSIDIRHDLVLHRLKIIIDQKYLDNYNISLYDIFGKLIVNDTSSGEYELDINSLQTGYYILSVSGRNFIILR